MRRHLMIAVLGISVTFLTVHGQSVPTTINYQGRLTDNTPAQTPMDGTVQMQFEIWDAATIAAGPKGGSTRLWREPNVDDSGVAVTVTGGIFSYSLGTTVPIPPTVFSSGGSRYLQIIINPGGSQELLSPRQLIGATGYANLSENANAAVSAATATTANALLSNGANCPPGSFPLGVDAGGAAEGCTVGGVGTVTEVTVTAPLTVSNGTSTPAISLTGIVPVANGGTGSGAQNFVDLSSGQTVDGAKTFTSTIGGSITGNAATATALAANGGNCSSGQYPKGVDVAGMAENCSAVSLTADVTGITPIANGGTGSSSISFVTITSQQTVTGAKTLFPSANSSSLVLRQSTVATAGTDIFAILNGGGTATYLTVDSTGKLIWSGTATGSISGNAATASTAVALVANGANCAAGSFPLGVDASGNAESCASAISGNAATASALGANGANCAAGSLASGVDASGNAEGCANTISGNAATATTASAAPWTGITGKPAGFADDVDNDTTYTAGTGLKLTGGEFSLTLNNSTPAGNGVATLNAVNNVGLHTSATIGDDGLPLISYYDFTNGNLMVSHCADAGCTSATSTTVDNSAVADVGGYNSITIGSDGLGLISYYDATFGNLKVAHCSDIPCTTATITLLDSIGVVGQYSSITIAADGFGIISYYDATGGNLKVADCSNLLCTAASVITAVSTNDVGRFTSIARDLNGVIVIGYQDVTNQNPVVAYCTAGNCSSPVWQPVDNAGLPGGFLISVAVGDDGEVILSHLAQSGEYELHLVHCAGTVCNSPSIAVIDTLLGGSPYPTSITIGPDAHPVLSYYDFTGGALKVAYCRSASCTAAYLSTVDFTGDVGRYAAITIGRDGLPLISYYDATNTALKTLHCANKYCIPYFRRR